MANPVPPVRLRPGPGRTEAATAASSEESALVNAPVDARHPDYELSWYDWQEMRDAVAGATTVKLNSTTYLPMPDGFKAMQDGGEAAYAAYKLRAQFPEIVEPTIRGMVGVIHRVPAKIELPTPMEYLLEQATPDGQTLDAFHRRCTREVFTTGRYGVLVDVDGAGTEPPYLSGYTAETILNWSPMSDLFTLDETGNVRKGYWWRTERQWRVLEKINGLYTVRLYGDGEGGPVARPVDVNELIVPTIAGGKPMTSIPFVVMGPLDVTPEVDEIPLLAVARAAFAEYRLDADYRHQLFMSGQETFVITGNIEPDRVPTLLGASVIAVLPEGASAAYVGPSGSGIAAHRQAMQDERMNAVMAGARLFDSSVSGAESGEALRIRWASQTATLLSVAMTVARGLEASLRNIALFMGLDPNAVTVTPNTSFVDSDMTPTDAAALVSLWQSDTVSKRTVYEILQKGGLTNPDRTYDDELAEIEKQPPPLAGEVLPGNTPF